MQQKLFQNLFIKRVAKTTKKSKKYMYQIFTENICSACNLTQVVVFGKYVLIL